VRATRRWVTASLRAHRGQSALTSGIVAAVVAWLALAVMLLQGASSPWLALHARTHGADVLVYLAPGTDTRALAALPGVREASQPVAAAPATLEQDTVRAPVELRGMPDAEPAMSAPLVIEGTWLSSARPDGAIVEASFATATHLGLGAAITLAGVDGTPVTARVAGIAETADQGAYPQWTPGLIWVTPALLRQVDPSPSESEEVVGLRLADRCTICVTDAVDEVASAVGAPVQRSVSWQRVSESMAASGWLLGELLGVFGLIALAAAFFAIANVTAARVLVQRQSIAMLKAIGFTTGEVILALLAEGLLLAVAGAIAGLVTAWGLSWLLPVVIRAPGGGAIAVSALPAGPAALIAAGTVAAVAAATALQAWRASRVSPVAAVLASPPRGRLSRLTRVSLVVRFPVPLVLGARDAFTRRALAALTIAGVALPMALITVALACWASIDGLTSDPARISLPAALTAYPDGEGSAAARAQIARDPLVRDSYPGAEFQVPLPGQAGTFTARAMGTARYPYPFRVTQGRMFASAGEAVATQRLLSLLHLGVGSRAWVTVNGAPMIFAVVGQVIDPAGDGLVLDFPVDALRGTGAAAPQFYSIILRPGADPVRAASALRAGSAGRLDVRPAANPADALGLLRVVIVVSVALLALAGIANLVTVTRVGLRDHAPEAGVLAALGLTPAEVTATLVIASAMLTAVGVLAGTVAGLAAAHWLVNAQAARIGLGWGVESLVPAPAMLATAMSIAVLAGTATALLIVHRATAVPHGFSAASTRSSRPEYTQPPGRTARHQPGRS
jgi:putative ABC transport system permease protein